MGKLLMLIVFAVFFVVFYLIRAAGQGVKAAYQAVFDPSNARARRFLTELHGVVGYCWSSTYRGTQDTLQAAIDLCVVQANALAQRHGLAIDRPTMNELIIGSLEAHRFATRDQVANALAKPV